MYYDTKIEHEFEMMNELVEKEMHNTRTQALKKFDSVIAHSNTVEAFAKILSYSWFDSLPDAEIIADRFELSKLDFLAINNDFEGFKEEYLNDIALCQNF